MATERTFRQDLDAAIDLVVAGAKRIREQYGREGGYGEAESLDKLDAISLHVAHLIWRDVGVVRQGDPSFDTAMRVVAAKMKEQMEKGQGS